MSLLIELFTSGINQKIPFLELLGCFLGKNIKKISAENKLSALIEIYKIFFTCEWN